METSQNEGTQPEETEFGAGTIFTRKDSNVTDLPPQMKIEALNAQKELAVPSELVIKPYSVTGAAKGVWTTVTLYKGNRFGPCDHRLTLNNDPNMEFSDLTNSWLHQVNSAMDPRDHNVAISHSHDGQVYLSILKDISTDSELLSLHEDPCISVKENMKPSEYLNGSQNVVNECDPKQFFQHKLGAQAVAHPQTKHVFEGIDEIGSMTCAESATTQNEHVAHELVLQPARIMQADHFDKPLNTIDKNHSDKIPTKVTSLKMNSENKASHKQITIEQKVIRNIKPQNHKRESDEEGKPGNRVLTRKTEHKSPHTSLMKSKDECDVRVCLNQIQVDLVHNFFMCITCNECFNDLTAFDRHCRAHAYRQQIHKCYACKKKFTSIREINSHMCNPKRHEHQCVVCGETFHLLATLERHKKTCERHRPHGCETCGRKFMLKQNLVRHIITHSEEDKPHHCEICGKRYLSKTGLKIHMLQHQSDGGYKCPTCNKTFRVEARLQIHMAGHTGIKPFSCMECGKCFMNNERLQFHLNDHKGIKRRYQCETCNYECNILQDLTKHRKTHKINKAYKCTECGKCFARRPHLRDHMSSHTGEKRYECKICGNKYSYYAGYYSHLLTHSDKRPHKCETCGKAFKDKSTLKKHQKSHSGVYPFECKICGKKFVYKGLMKLHMHYNHPTEEERLKRQNKEYKCEICGKGFTSKKYSRNHMRVHTGEKPYKCTYCDKTFTFNSSLKTHERVHTGEKPKKCNICGKAFTSNSTLASHIRIHSDERPYKCTMCDAAFKVRGCLRSHTLTHKGIKPYSCTRCGKKFASSLSLRQHYAKNRCRNIPAQLQDN